MATVTGSPSGSRYLTIRRATATPRSSASHTAQEKNQHARRNCPAIPAAAATATTVRRLARIIPHASATNSAWVERRLNTGASSSSRARQVTGTGRPGPKTRAGPSARSPASAGGPSSALSPAGQPSSRARVPPAPDGKQHEMADWPAKEASQRQMIMISHLSYGASLLLSRRHALQLPDRDQLSPSATIGYAELSTPGVRRPATPRPARPGDQRRLSTTCRDETRKHEMSSAGLCAAPACSPW